MTWLIRRYSISMICSFAGIFILKAQSVLRLFVLQIGGVWRRLRFMTEFWDMIDLETGLKVWHRTSIPAPDQGAVLEQSGIKLLGRMEGFVVHHGNRSSAREKDLIVGSRGHHIVDTFRRNLLESLLVLSNFRKSTHQEIKSIFLFCLRQKFRQKHGRICDDFAPWPEIAIHPG